MPLPGDLATVVVTGSFTGPSGTPLAGKVIFTPSAVLTDATGKVIVAESRTCHLSAGAFETGPLVATGNADIFPQGWAYITTVALQNAAPVTYSLPIPADPSPVDISALIAAAG